MNLHNIPKEVSFDTLQGLKGFMQRFVWNNTHNSPAEIKEFRKNSDDEWWVCWRHRPEHEFGWTDIGRMNSGNYWKSNYYTPELDCKPLGVPITYGDERPV